MSAYIGLSQHIEFARLPTPGDRFELQDLIGEGTYGEVYCAKDKTTGKKVAIKILETIADNLEEIEEEYLVLRDLSTHPNLPSFVGIFLRKGACFEDDQLWFVMEVRKLSYNFFLFRLLFMIFHNIMVHISLHYNLIKWFFVREFKLVNRKIYFV